MTVLKCKMCGGDLSVEDEMSICECEFCGTKQTVPKVDDEKKLKLFDRANRLRFNCEFDKAAAVYESIISDYSEEAEGYWGLLLCKYGIEYVDDPATGKKIPTCHRSSFDSIMDDVDFEMVMENSDSKARSLYREEAKYIEEIRKGIIEVSGKESPYDIFICYKETDENGERTLDSVLAQDVYDELTNRGYRVFFSRISLEDKLGVEYEPYIFAALNSAKIMLAFGTSYDFYNAVWVKNEWSRYLKLMAKDKTKHLIPCFKGIDAYDIPKEFNRFQSQDMGKIGAIQDLMRGIEKLLAPEKKQEPKIEAPVFAGIAGNVLPFIKRGYMALEDGEWSKAVEFFEQALNIDAENGQAYWGELLAEQKCSNYGVLAGKLLKSVREMVDQHYPDVLETLETGTKYAEWKEKFVTVSMLSESEIKKIFYNYSSLLSKKTYVLDLAAQYREKSILDGNKIYIRAKKFADDNVREDMNRLEGLIQDGIKKISDDIENEEKDIHSEQNKRISEYYNELEKEFIQADADYQSYKDKHAEWERNKALYDEWQKGNEKKLLEWRKQRDDYLAKKKRLQYDLDTLETQLNNVRRESKIARVLKENKLVAQIAEKNREITQLNMPANLESINAGCPKLEDEPSELTFKNSFIASVFKVLDKYSPIIFDQANMNDMYNSCYNKEEMT